MNFSWLTWTITLSGVVGSILWISQLAYLIRHRKKAVFLADLELPRKPTRDLDGLDDRGWPSVAILFAARDEASGVEAAVRSMLAEVEDDPGTRLIAVDDRSVDGTGAILDRLAEAHPRLEVVHITELPKDWLGKTHALQRGSESPGAQTRWLLFTDADVVFQPGTIRKAVAYAETMGVDQITVGPEVDTRSVGERIFLSLFGLLFSLHVPIGRLSDRRSRVHIGVGAFNLVRAEAFRAIGGFRHLSLSIDDDMRLGQTLKYAGYSMRLLLGRDAISVRWQVGTWGMIRGLEKNFFAGLKFQLSRVFVVMAGIFTLGIAPFGALIVGPTGTRVIAAAGVTAILVILVASGRQSRIGWYYGFLLPAAAVLMMITLGRSVVLTLVQGGVNWRNHHYPLTTLKLHVQQRDEWLEEVWQSTR